MHPLAAISLVFLAAIAWMGTILTLLIALVKARSRPPAEPRSHVQSAETRNSDDRVRQT
ncbi:hypothetical protein [Arthrobacter sp. SLBN-122]|uniref:hypothetical protein n=1 Tax=Arthrobacter sp. SLBN-122 TaxID=2768455 RepID=UPI00116B88BE|nr:hypothetical protein [Arthrobacter sp. SLBN-122]TQJ36474.1 hypothetical protein FBY36_3774 [Arthrobacter sp. SLBN-122]